MDVQRLLISDQRRLICFMKEKNMILKMQDDNNQVFFIYFVIAIK